MLLLTIVSLFFPSNGDNGDAPQWGSFRGNNGAGLAAASKLPDALDPEGTLQWRVEVPSGYSSPVPASVSLLRFTSSASGAPPAWP